MIRRPLVAALVLLTATCGPRTRLVSAPPATVEGAATNMSAVIAPRGTYCNPIDIGYRFAIDAPSRRDVADPVITRINGEYFLFAARSGGYWHSRDFRDWQLVVPTGLPLENDAPAVLVLDGKIYFTADASMALYTTDDPTAGAWHKVASLPGYRDPAFFLDTDGSVYLYHRSAQRDAIAVVRLDPANGFAVMDGPREVVGMTANSYSGNADKKGVGRPSVTKHDGTYYLQYSPLEAPAGTGSGVYTSRSPTSAFSYAAFSPVGARNGGFAGTADRGTIFRDSAGGYWSVATIAVTDSGTERRLGIRPVRFDADGVMRVDTWLGDYPQQLPDGGNATADHNASGWMLLSARKKASASSRLDDHDVTLAVDEDIHSWWSAATGGVGEWFSVDLGTIARVAAIQINFAEQGTRALGHDDDSYQQYIVESSLDGVHWTRRLDESSGSRDVPHHYVQLDSARNARFVRITNVHAAAGGTFAIRDLRVFGRSPIAPPPAVNGVVVRRAGDGSAALTWARAPRATGYIARYGTAPDKLYATYQVGDVAGLTLTALNSGVPYWFAVDAIGEGGVTPGRTVRKQ